MKSEIVKTRLLDDIEHVVPMARDDFYQEQIEVFKAGGKPTRAVDIVVVMLFTEKKELIIQKRSKTKFHNPRLFDKSLGGHIRFGDTVEFTVMAETIQELQVPSIVLRDDADFKKGFDLLKNYLSTIALIKHVDSELFHMKKRINERDVEIASFVHFFLGVYGGRTKAVDREATGILYYSLKDLKEEMKESPELFTQDLHMFLEVYSKEIKSYLDGI